MAEDPYARRRRRLGYYLPAPQIIAIFGLLIGLFAIIALKDSCAQGVGNLFRAFEAPDAGAGGKSPMPTP